MAVVVAPTPPRVIARGGTLHWGAAPLALLERALDGTADHAFAERQRNIVAEADGDQVAIKRDVVDTSHADHDAVSGNRRLQRRSVGYRVGRIFEIDNHEVEIARPFAQRERRIDRALAYIGFAEGEVEEVRGNARLGAGVGHEHHGADRRFLVTRSSENLG